MVATAPQEWIAIVPRRRLADNEEPGILARIIYRLRAERGLTQIEVAQRAGWVGNSYYSDLERGVIKLPGEERVAALERAFGVPPGSIEEQLPRRSRLMLESAPDSTSATAQGGMEVIWRQDEVIIRKPERSARRIIEHLSEMSERELREAELNILMSRDLDEDVAAEERADRETGTNEPTA